MHLIVILLVIIILLLGGWILIPILFGILLATLAFLLAAIKWLFTDAWPYLLLGAAMGVVALIVYVANGQRS